MAKSKSSVSRSLFFTFMVITFAVVLALASQIKQFTTHQSIDASATLAASLGTTFSQQLTTYTAAKTPTQQLTALNNLRTTARARKQAMLGLVKSPATFIANVLPASKRTAIPRILYDEGLIEQDAAFSGKMFLGHIDAKKPSAIYTFVYTSGIVSQGTLPKGKSYALYLTRQPTVKTHVALKVKGYLYPGILVADSANTNNFITGSIIKPSLISPTTARSLIILVNYQGASAQPFTAQTLQREVFDTTNRQSVYSYFKEVSGGKFSHTGEVKGWVSLNQVGAGCDINYNEWGRQARDMLGVNPANYAAIGYVFPVPAGCGSRAWASLGTAEWWIVNNAVAEVKGLSVHEFGHLLGLVHANFINCGQEMILKNYTTGCTNIEYNDFYDPMGAASNPLRHYSTIVKYDLGWLNLNEVANVTVSGKHSLIPVERYPSTSGTKALRIRRPGTNEYYFIEYRTRTGFDNINEFPAGGSIFVRLAGTNYDSIGTSYATHSLIIDTHPGDNNPINAMMTATGEQFVDKANNITVKVVSMTPQAAQIEITIGISCAAAGQICAGGIAGINRNCCSGLTCTPPSLRYPDAASTCQ